MQISACLFIGGWLFAAHVRTRRWWNKVVLCTILMFAFCVCVCVSHLLPGQLVLMRVFLQQESGCSAFLSLADLEESSGISGALLLRETETFA